MHECERKHLPSLAKSSSSSAWSTFPSTFSWAAMVSSSSSAKNWKREKTYIVSLRRSRTCILRWFHHNQQKTPIHLRSLKKMLSDLTILFIGSEFAIFLFLRHWWRGFIRAFFIWARLLCNPMIQWLKANICGSYQKHSVLWEISKNNQIQQQRYESSWHWK